MARTFALITALNQYSPIFYGNIPALRGCIVDAGIFRSTFGRSIDIFHSLYDISATIEQVKSALKAIAKEMKDGDQLIWYHSGHGSYADNSKGKRATCRCLYDGLLWDADVLKMLKIFPKGTKIVTISDTCYSESNSRVPVQVGTPKAYVLKQKPTKVATTGRTPAGISLISLSACTIEQVAYETEDGGVFTAAMRKVFAVNNAEELSWLGLFKAASLNVPEVFRQHPVLDYNTLGKKDLHDKICNC